MRPIRLTAVTIRALRTIRSIQRAVLTAVMTVLLVAPTTGAQIDPAPKLTRDVPRFVLRHCAAARKTSPLRVVCPPLVPVTKYRTFPGVSGTFNGNEPPAKIALLGFNGGDTGPVFWHWIAGIGTQAGI